MVLDIGNYPNFARSDVTATVNGGDTSISITDATQFDTGTPPFLATIWDTASGAPDEDDDVELLEVTGVDTGTNTLTVTRGVGQTTDTSHPDTSAVVVPATANLFTDIDDALNSVGSYSGGTIDSVTAPFGGTDINLGDAAADPAAAGEMRRNGTDVKVFSGGAVKNISNIGSGGGGTSAPAGTISNDTLASGESITVSATETWFLPNGLTVENGGDVTIQNGGNWKVQ